MSDVINPAHYAGDEVQRFIESRELGFSLGNVIKYVARAGHKDGQSAVTDLSKAAWYLDRAIRAAEMREIKDALS